MIISKNITYPYRLSGSIILTSFFIIEAIRKLFHENIDVTHISYIFKSVIVLALLFIILRRKKTFIFYALFILLLLFLIGQLSISNLIISHTANVFTRYAFPLVIFSCYNLLPKEDKGELFGVFKWIIFLNSALIILGYAFDLNILKTYISNQRFGYNGLFYASATSSYVYAIYIIYITNNIRKKRKITVFSFISIFACLFIGTKSIYLVLIIAVSYIIYLKLNKYKLIIIPSFLLVILIVLVKAVSSSVFLLGFANGNNFLTVLLSKRDLLFMNNSLPYIKNNWGILNYMFGGLKDPNLRSQMALIDLILIFGFLGSLVYLWLYKSLYFNFKLHRFEIIGYIVLTFIALLAGNFLMYTFSQLVFLVLKDLIIKKEK